MSRIAKYPVELPKGVEASIQPGLITVKGPLGTLSQVLNGDVVVSQESDKLSFVVANETRAAKAMSGTLRALVANMVNGVSKGFERKLQLVGVGYKAQAKGKVLNLALGYSHPIDYELPEGVTAETPTPTEILLKSNDKQLLGQAAADIRGFRPPEPYKGKGVRYSDEVILRKEAKKK